MASSSAAAVPKSSGKVEEGEEMLIRLESSTHVASLTKQLEEQFLKAKLVDVALVTEEGQFINAHKAVLSAGSQYFKKVIAKASSHHTTSCSQMIICLSDIKYSYLYPLIKYIYTGRLEVSQQDLKPLVKTAFHLKISGLYEEHDEQEDGNGVENAAEGEGDGTEDEDGVNMDTFVKEEKQQYKEHDDEFPAMEGEENEEHSIELDPAQFAGPEDDDEEEEDSNEDNGEFPFLGPAFDQSYGETETKPNVQKLKGTTTGNNAGGGLTVRRNKESFPYHCSNCGNGYTCSKSLWRHRKYNCKSSLNKVAFVCSFCSKAFSRSDNLKRHIVVAHTVDTTGTSTTTGHGSNSNSGDDLAGDEGNGNLWVGSGQTIKHEPGQKQELSPINDSIY